MAANKKVESMAIYTCFIQHVINSLSKNGKGAIVVPTGFITAGTGIEKKILKHIVDEHIVYGCISMPSNVFATTGTNVSVLFFDNSKKSNDVILIDASKLGEDYKENNVQKRRLREHEIKRIIDNFLEKRDEDDFSKVVDYEQIKEKGYSLSAGKYFDIKIQYKEISKEEFNNQIEKSYSNLKELFEKSNILDDKILKELGEFKYEEI